MILYGWDEFDDFIQCECVYFQKLKVINIKHLFEDFKLSGHLDGIVAIRNAFYIIAFE